MTSHSLRSFAMVGALFAGAAILPSSLRAQRSSTTDSMVVAVTSAAGGRALQDSASTPVSVPRVAQAALTRPDALPAFASESQNRSNNVGVGSNVALMGVGAAGVVIGLLVGGDGGAAISIGGGALGLYGLYRYLR